jgi:nucleoside-diphosphate-sugar epimerase
MRVLVTGHRGYIGSHLVDLLRRGGDEVVGCDVGLFDGCEWETPVPPDRELRLDVRRLEERHLEGCDVVMHLAALSNDPMGDLDASLTLDVNRDASIRLAQVAKRAGVRRFLFAGSCSVYGKGDKLDLEETDRLDPLTAYARSKIDAERAILALADGAFSPSVLRCATAFGHSPMLRIDLVVNNLLGSALAYGEIRIHSDGTPWRPLLHCRDIARAFIAFAKAPREALHGRAVNVGGNAQNYQVKDVGDQVQRLVPGAKIVYTGEVGADPRNYRVRFDLLERLLPGWRPETDLVRGMEELHRKMVEHRFSKEDFEGERFVRLRTLKRRMGLLGVGAAT